MESDFVKPLLLWYNAAKRDLPWRRTSDPYRIYVSEIMLQQTRVEAVIGYYERFIRELPDVRALAECPEDKLLKLWEGLGYYSRVRNMKRTAGILLGEYDGSFPEEAAELMKLPGIGSYTAGAVSSIAYGRRSPAVDGNVLRVYARMTALKDNILLPAVRKRAEADLGTVMECLPDASVPGTDNPAGDFNQSMIELGALLCVPGREPGCALCPVAPHCEGRRLGLESSLPVRLKETVRRVEERTVLLIRDGEEAAVRRRPAKGLLAGLYEFPNAAGHLSAGEAERMVEALGLMPLRIRRLRDAKHLFSHVEWQMVGYEILVGDRNGSDGSTGGSADSADLLFANREELADRYALPSAFSAYADYLSLHRGGSRSK